MVEGARWGKREGKVLHLKTQKEKDYRKTILHNEMGSETRGKVSRRLQPNLVLAFLSLLSVSSPHCPYHSTFISRSLCGTEQPLTFFSLQILLLFSLDNILLRFLKFAVLLTTQENLCGKICFRYLVGVSAA